MSCWKFFLVLLAVLITTSGGVVFTNTGPVEGKMVAYGKVEAFLGIPYAEPPVGRLRFSKPVPKTSWFDVYDATRMPPACTQAKLRNVTFAPDADYMSEDCLYLNLWVPRSQCTFEPKTIMLFIHGGGFSFGSANMPIYNGAKLAEYGDVIVVNINYRLAGLGFLTDLTEDAPGSVGLYDQVMAIKWIKENARHFNGDPESIVLFGESAGAWAASFHQISPLSRNLFKRVILQSGSALSPTYDDTNAQHHKINKVYADLTGCKYGDRTNSQRDFVNCLRKVPAEQFSEIETALFKKGVFLQIPRVGNDILPESTIDAFRKGHFKGSEVLMGITRDEGTVLLSALKPDLFGLFGEKAVPSMFNETTTYYIIKAMIQNGDPAEVDKIIRGYLNDVNDDTEYTYLRAASDAIGDFLITCGKIFQAEYHSLKGNPVFFYLYDHRPASSPYAEWIGVAHFDEVQFVFGNPMHKYFTEYEMELSRNIMNKWTTFAKTGNPDIPGEVSWPRYTYRDPKYFIIGKQHDNVGLRPDHYRCERWRNLYRSVIDERNIAPPRHMILQQQLVF